jgi:hypothetical protein
VRARDGDEKVFDEDEKKLDHNVSDEFDVHSTIEAFENEQGKIFLVHNRVKKKSRNLVVREEEMEEIEENDPDVQETKFKLNFCFRITVYPLVFCLILLAKLFWTITQETTIFAQMSYDYYVLQEEVYVCEDTYFSLSDNIKVWKRYGVMNDSDLIMDKVWKMSDIASIYYFVRRKDFISFDEQLQHKIWACVTERQIILYEWTLKYSDIILIGQHYIKRMFYRSQKTRDDLDKIDAGIL